MAARKREMVALGSLVSGVNLPEALQRLKIGGLCIDSRQLRPGDLFLAFPGTRADGRDYIDAAVARGAVAVLAESRDLVLEPRIVPIIPVRNLMRRLPVIASRFYGEPARDLMITGVTGTNGKTTCTQLLAQLLAQLTDQCGVVGTLGSRVVRRTASSRHDDTGMTTPDPVRLQAILAEFKQQGARHVAMEVSSHSLDQDRVAAVPFRVAIFTNLTRDHLDYHGTLSNYIEAKLKLFRRPGLFCAIINADDPLAGRVRDAVGPDTQVLSYGLSDKADIRCEDVEASADGLVATLVTPWGEGELRSSLIGAFNLGNLMAVVAAASVQGFELADVLAAVPALQPIPGRMEVVRPGVQPLVVIDYAHTPDALEQVLKSLRSHCGTGGQLWCVFGCGGDRDQGKRSLMGTAASRFADRLVLTSDNPRNEEPQAIIDAILEGVRGTHPTVLLDRAAAIAHAIAQAAEVDVVVIAGKGHETYQEVVGQRLPFSDLYHARMALNQRGGDA